MYTRFETPELDARGRRVGVFALANGLARAGRLASDEWGVWRAGNDWFDHAYPHPPADAYSDPRAAAWFGPAAGHLVAAVRPYLLLLARHGVACRRVETHDPGRIVFSDAVQVVAVPRDADGVDRRRPQ
ncbi:hypothetical protein [Litorihabitans aurantiacus]|uniref:Uncharacterized protein n=1 Tax=Litorihabitans aurantiacus TaxID=1930061 RepID=A0AA38CVH1_9MICO|nr:hypothetical protein [Litorihabitans aurantiacus]GMA32950.1 hypothetical protein GCM10025875_29420 [Litorihabitans aurantiacus]